MWKPISVGGQEFVLKTDTVEFSRIHKISLTDFVNLWYEQISDEALIKRSKELNPMFEAQPDVLVNHVLSLLDTENTGSIKHIEKEDDQILLTVESRFDYYKYNFKFILKCQPSEHLYKELTLPLLQMITELQRRKKLLTSLLAKKDIEIAQYKLEGAELIRKNVQTEPFDEDAFNKKCLETLPERKNEVELHPAKVFTISTVTLYQQVTAPLKQLNLEAENSSAIEPEMENTIQALLNEKRVSPKKSSNEKKVSPQKSSKHKKPLPVEPLESIEVKAEIQIKKEAVPAKKRKPRVLLKNL